MSDFKSKFSVGKRSQRARHPRIPEQGEQSSFKPLPREGNSTGSTSEKSRFRRSLQSIPTSAGF